MTKFKLILSSVVISLCMAFAFSGGVSATTELDEVNFTTDKALVRYNLITSGVVEEDGVTATIDKWFMGGSVEDPGQEVTGNRYLQGSKYIAQVTFTPEDGYAFSEYADFYMNDEWGYFVSEDDVTGAVTVNFDVPLHWIVSFETNTSQVIDDQYVEVNGYAEEPTAPTKDGYTFYGWCDDEDYDNCSMWDFNWQQVYDHTDLYALFVPNSKVIKNVDLNLTLPSIGTKYTLVDDGSGYGQIQSPEIKIASKTANINPYAELYKNGETFEWFTGTITAGTDYYFGIDLYLMNGYRLDKNGVSVTVNGQKLSNSEILSYADDYDYAFIKHKVKITAPAIVKKANPMVVTTKNKKVKYKKVKKKAQTVSAITVSKAQGKVTYKKVSGKKKITVNATTGKITVKKKTKKGTYKIKVQVNAAGNKNYKAASKTVTLTIKVK